MNNFTIGPDGCVIETSIHEAVARYQPMAPTVDPLAIEASRMVVAAFGSLARYLAPYRAEFSLTGARYAVLRVLFEADDEALTMREIANRLAVTPPNVTNLIEGLVRDGLVERRRHPSDRRVVHVALTEAGHERFQAVTPHTLRRFEDAFSGFSEQERRQLIHLLAKLRMMLLARPDASTASGSPEKLAEPAPRTQP